MALALPLSLTPSKVSSFTSCGLAFKFSTIDGLPEPPSPWATKGTLVHRALERLHADVPAGARTPEAARRLVLDSWDEVRTDEQCTGLQLEDEAAFLADAAAVAANVFALEDPNAVEAIGLELKLEARAGDVVLRGVIDRLDRRSDGSLVVVDYKTGRAPGAKYEKGRLAGVQLYAFLVEECFGVRPARIELLHLREPVAIAGVPTDQSTAQLRRRTSAIWSAIALACEQDDFQPRRSGLCDVCAFRERCPLFAGATGAAA